MKDLQIGARLPIEGQTQAERSDPCLPKPASLVLTMWYFTNMGISTNLQSPRNTSLLNPFKRSHQSTETVLTICDELGLEL